MAMILCGQHGKQPCVFTSPRFAEAIAEGAEVDAPIILQLSLPVGIGLHLVDIEFLKERGIDVPENATRISIADEEAAFQLYGALAPVCRICYEEYLAQHGLARPHFLQSDSDKN